MSTDKNADIRQIDTLDDIKDGLSELILIDPRLEKVIKIAGDLPLRRKTPGYQGLAEIIVAQMVSKASANAIWKRLIEHTGDMAPDNMLALTDKDCRIIGLSGAKERTLRATAEAVSFGQIDPMALCLLPAKDAMNQLTAIKGIGPWTAEVFLLFCAGHGDIFPSGDVALQSAVGHALAFKNRPNAKQLTKLAQKWSPWRGVAARLFWAYYAVEFNRNAQPIN